MDMPEEPEYTDEEIEFLALQAQEQARVQLKQKREYNRLRAAQRKAFADFRSVQPKPSLKTVG